MLVLSRKKDEKIIIGDQITVMVIEIRGDKVRLGIDAPKEISVHRQEVYEAIQREQAAVKDAKDAASGSGAGGGLSIDAQYKPQSNYPIASFEGYHPFETTFDRVPTRGLARKIF